MSEDDNKDDDSDLSEFTCSSDWLPSDTDSVIDSEQSIPEIPEYAIQDGHDFGLGINKEHRWRYHKHESEVYKIVDSILVNNLVYYRVRWEKTKNDCSKDLWLEYSNLKKCKSKVDEYILTFENLLKQKFDIVSDVTEEVVHYHLEKQRINSKEVKNSILKTKDDESNKNHKKRKMVTEINKSNNKRRKIEKVVF